MGFMRSSPERPTVETVATASGRVTVLDGETQVGSWAKARLWVMADRQAVLVTSSDGREVSRAVYEVETAHNDRRRRELVVETTSGQLLVASTAGCGCGMGVVGSAGPIDGPYRVVRVRAPEWFEVT